MGKIQIGDLRFSTGCSKIIRAWLRVETNEDAKTILENEIHQIRPYIRQESKIFGLDVSRYNIPNDPYGYIQKWDHIFETWVNWIPLYCDPNENNTCFEILEETNAG
jgi:hypothetical protein